jgi:DNA cross-link repair 1A protein
MLSVDSKWVHPLPLDKATIIPNTGGVSVTPIEANHCTSLLFGLTVSLSDSVTGPGSCLLLFEGRQTTDAGDSVYKSPFVGSTRIFRFLHCGDFRASPQHVLHPAVKGKRIDHVYLDTTYLDPKVNGFAFLSYQRQ